MEKLIVDMDDVLTINGFIRMVNEFLNSNYTQEDAKSYYINDLVPEEKMQDWIKFFSQKNVYDYVDISEDCQEVLKKLNDKYDIYIVTGFVFRDAPQLSGKLLKDKYDFLYKNFPFINPHNFMFASKKEVVNADVRIDDSPEKLKGNAKLKLLYTAYHNKDLTDEELKKDNLIRVNSWKEIESILG